MAIPVPSGRDAAVLKYDLLTALTVWAYRQPRRVMTSALRLIGVITARYDWRRDELSVGREWLASFWAVDPSTAKREMKRLRDLGLISLVAAGVRGRVSRYRLERGVILALAQPVGDAVGPDFCDRVADQVPPQPPCRERAPKEARSDNVVPFGQVRLEASKQGSDTSADGEPATSHDGVSLRRALECEAPSIYRAWFTGTEVKRHAGHICVILPSPYRAAYARTNHARLLSLVCARLWPDDGPPEILSREVL